MPDSSLASVGQLVLRRARRHGSLTARDIKEELALAGLAEDQWKQVVELLHGELALRRGRYYPADAEAAPQGKLGRQREQQHAIDRVIRAVLKEYREEARKAERRGSTRVAFMKPVQVQRDDGSSCTLVGCDLSATGIRLLGTHRLLGQRVAVQLGAHRLAVRILWTCAIGEDLFENGGGFLEVLPSE